MIPDLLIPRTFVLSARPAQYGDTLSFDTKPERRVDLMLVSVRWSQPLPRSEFYWHAVAKNVTVGDTVASIPLFIQKSYFEERFANLAGEATFTLDGDFQFGQEDDSGKNRFVVLHDLERKPSQHRFVPTQITRIGNIVHALATAAGFADKVDPLRPLEDLLLNQPMRTFIRPLACAGDILLVPAQDQQGMVKVALSWKVELKAVKENYYMGVVKNKTYEHNNVIFFIHAERYENGSHLSLPSHISKLAPKNEDGAFEFTVAAHSQYGEERITSKGRFVVYHDQKLKPPQYVFVNAALAHTTALSSEAASLVQPDLEVIAERVKKMFGEGLITFL
ncbi:hypothetical protein OH76DRAFT_1410939 [Lentinus brumalis]|uniref:Uncharacterized protein n=1 Tax=Lentinus brumalis TaxID=2498619 RepID=A0A371CQW8_9APHY|nr:hypothetical protein OH76DRAFT_1410939 [Polyporus brumalis]